MMSMDGTVLVQSPKCLPPRLLPRLQSIHCTRCGTGLSLRANLKASRGFSEYSGFSLSSSPSTAIGHPSLSWVSIVLIISGPLEEGKDKDDRQNPGDQQAAYKHPAPSPCVYLRLSERGIPHELPSHEHQQRGIVPISACDRPNALVAKYCGGDAPLPSRGSRSRSQQAYSGRRGSGGERLLADYAVSGLEAPLTAFFATPGAARNDAVGCTVCRLFLTESSPFHC
jgi:hypothetical protein